VAFDALVRQYENQVLRLALHLTGSEHDAEDIYQEAFLKAFRYIGNFRFECSFYTWIIELSQILLGSVEAAQDAARRFAVLVDHSGDEIDLLASVSDNRSYSSPDRELDRKVLGERIQAALGKLTPRERMVFELNITRGFACGLSRDVEHDGRNRKNTLFRATKKLRLQWRIALGSADGRLLDEICGNLDQICRTVGRGWKT